MTNFTRITGIAALAVALLAGGPAIAQSQGGQQADQAAPNADNAEQAQDVSQEQLQKFSKALDQIRDIRQSAMKTMQKAGSQDDRTQVRKQAQQKMLAAIKDSGLTLQEYNQIGHAVQSNPDLAKKLQEMQ